jgi:hypothetical protein
MGELQNNFDVLTRQHLCQKTLTALLIQAILLIKILFTEMKKNTYTHITSKPMHFCFIRNLKKSIIYCSEFKV